MTLLVIESVSKRFDTVEGAAQGPLVLDGLDLSLEAGQAMAIVGPSGCGKSTLLALIGGLDQPTSGRVELDGEDMAELDEPSLARVRNETLGFVFQDHHLLPQCTALENVLVPTLVRDVATRKEAPQRARALLERVGLGERMNHRPAQLSGGERQRVAVVRALINQPSLLLADEPTGSLDSEAAQGLGELLLEQSREEGAALIVVTHSPDLARRVGRTLTLDRGRLLP